VLLGVKQSQGLFALKFNQADTGYTTDAKRHYRNHSGDFRAARNIIAAREIGSLQELASVKYVGKKALEKIRAYVPQFTPLVVEDKGAGEGDDW